MASYERPSSGEWFEPRLRGYRLMCCDCGLVHRVDFRIYRGQIQMRAVRHPGATAVARRNTPVWIRLKLAEAS